VINNLDPWYLENLVCPVDKSRLRLAGALLVSESGRNYPIVEGIPVMLVKEATDTIEASRVSLEVAAAVGNGGLSEMSPLYLATLGISDSERAIAKEHHANGGPYDAVAAAMIGATSGMAYRRLIEKDTGYPIPRFRFPTITRGRLLDVGCNWGRWTIAAARAGFESVGIDPQLGAVLSARRVASQLGVKARFVVGDARYLPFSNTSFEAIWSYSVLQHFSTMDAKNALMEIGRVSSHGATIRIQMANALGARSFYHMARRGFRSPVEFEVRYRSPRELKRLFSKAIGNARIEADCFFGLGFQWSDFRFMHPVGKFALLASESLVRFSKIVVPLCWFADSVFCTVQSLDRD
jgi:SAM-dependent methyltransferase/uncharacterized protein YbaR (Trm112 family)